MKENKFALVIDNSVAMRSFVSLVLRQDEHFGSQIVEAENLDHALTLLAQREGQLDFVVSDWNTSGMPLQAFIERVQRMPKCADMPLFLLDGEDASNFSISTMAEAVGEPAVPRKPFTPEQLIALVMNSVAVMERRRARRVVPLVCCEVDLGFSQDSASYSGAIINISETGMLLRSPVLERGVGHIYDVATLTIFAANCPPIKLYAQVVRLEVDHESRDQSVRIAFEFRQLDHASSEALHNFILLNNPTEGGLKN